VTQPDHNDNARDEELVRAATAGGLDARRALADRVLDRIRTSVRYLCGGHPDGADFVQLCLVEVLRSVHSFRGESRLETWVDRVTLRTTLRHLKARRAELAAQRPEETALPAPTDDPERALSRARVQERLADLLQKLTPERRSALVLQIVYGYSLHEIATLTDAPLETVRDRLKVGKKQLRRLVRTDDALREWAKDPKP
jgi:RNA polymerase sigma-70 factor (ECF subfamily)